MNFLCMLVNLKPDMRPPLWRGKLFLKPVHAENQAKKKDKQTKSNQTLPFYYDAMGHGIVMWDLWLHQFCQNVETRTNIIVCAVGLDVTL